MTAAGRKGSPAGPVNPPGGGEDSPVEPLSPFNPALLRRSSIDGVDVVKMYSSISAGKPDRNRWFRVNPDPGYMVDTAVIEWEVDGRKVPYLVSPAVDHLLVSEIRMVRIFTCVDKNETPFLWPCKLPTADSGPGFRWAESALQLAEKGMQEWVKLVGDRNLGAYMIITAKGDLGEPVWPKESFEELLTLGFSNRFIQETNHEVIKELNGEL